jgi:hypothetical protein
VVKDVLFERKACCSNLKKKLPKLLLGRFPTMAIVWRSIVVCALLMLEAEPGLARPKLHRDMLDAGARACQRVHGSCYVFPQSPRSAPSASL